MLSGVISKMKLNKTAMYQGMFILAVSFATGCSTTEENVAVSATTASVEQSISAAKTALTEAEKGGYAWRDTGKFIKQAEGAAAAGDLEKASSLSQKALEQSELAKKQKIEQDLAVKERFK